MICHIHVGNLDLGFGRTEQRNYIEMGISSPGGQIGGQTNGSLTSASIIDHPQLLGWLWLAQTSSNQFLPVVAHV